MKISFLFIFLLFTPALIAKNIDFVNGTLEHAMKLAKDQKKLVFIAYENYSGKSRWMEQKVFSDTTVCLLYSNRFVSIKINAESMRDKAMFSDFKYQSSAATCFFFTPKGELIHKINAPTTPKELISETKKALNIYENFISLEKMDKMFRRGEQSTQFLYLYSLRRLQSIDLGNIRARHIKDLDKSIKSYMAKLSDEDFATEQNMLLACEYLYETNKNCSDELFIRLKNKLELIDNFSEENAAGFRQRIGRIIDRSFNQAAMTNNPELMTNVVNAIDESWFEKSTIFYNKENLISMYKIDFYEMTKDWANYKNEVVIYMNRINTINTEELASKAMMDYKQYDEKLKFADKEWNQLYDEMLKFYNEEVAHNLRMYGWGFAQYIDDKETLKVSLKWLSKSIRLSPNPIAVKTYSKLLYKVGREEEAKKYTDLLKKSPSTDDIQIILAKEIRE